MFFFPAISNDILKTNYQNIIFLPYHKVKDVKEDGSLDVNFLLKKGDHYTIEETVKELLPGPPNFYSISLVCPLSFHVREDKYFFLV